MSNAEKKKLNWERKQKEKEEREKVRLKLSLFVDCISYY